MLDLSDSDLVFSSDSLPGFRRQRSGKGFRYLDAEGKAIQDASMLDRIQSLVIPPAWENVWICPDPLGFLQATGRDQKGRKQAIYHPDWVAQRQATKFQSLAEFGRVLPKIRAQVDRDLRQKGLSKTRVLATAVNLLEQTLIRVGNSRYVQQNNSFGLTTLKNRHAVVKPTFVQFRFKGKSGQQHQIRLSDRRIASILRRCQELPGQNLFVYRNEEGEPCRLDSRDVNAYLASIAMPGITAKHFRTWAGTIEAVKLIRQERPTSNRALAGIVKEVASRLGNTASVCRSYYIHPKVLEGFKDAEWVSMPLPRVRSAYKEPIEVLVLNEVLT